MSGWAPLERHQVWLYLLAVGVGAGIGVAVDGGDAALEALIRPALGTLLFVTFLQVRFDRLRSAFADRRFVTLVLVANFVAVPLLVWPLLSIVSDDPAVRLGVVIVLLVPCTDWFLTFTQLGGGDLARAVVVTPLNLLVQFALLPVYLWIFDTAVFEGVVDWGEALETFLTLVVIPLVLAAGVRGIVQRRGHRDWIDRAGVLAVPLVAVVVFLITATQVDLVTSEPGLLPRLTIVYVLYAMGALGIAVGLGRATRLAPPSARTLAFSVGTRNSFVVLPFALALPEAYALAALVVVYQSLVELLAVAAYLRYVPRVIPLPRSN